MSGLYFLVGVIVGIGVGISMNDSKVPVMQLTDGHGFETGAGKPVSFCVVPAGRDGSCSVMVGK